MTTIVFIVSALAGIILVGLSVASLVWRRLRIWPPESPSHWQYATFWWLFRIMVAGIVIISLLDYRGAGDVADVLAALGWGMAIGGFGLAFYITHFLGWRDAHGEASGLKTTGSYAYSRNPIYVVSFVGMLGVAIAIHSYYVAFLLSLWAILYLIAPFLEEPWLEAQYGSEYVRYKQRVPRFIGRRRH